MCYKKLNLQWDGLLVRPSRIKKNIMDIINSEFHIHKRNLPHWQVGGRSYFVTFRSAIGSLSTEAIKIVKYHILFDHARRYDLLFGVVMPDHVHLLFRPLSKEDGSWYDLPQIIRGIKGTSAKRINALLGISGKVWQEEYFDRMIRNEAEMLEKWNYIWNNPLKKGLADSFEEYQFYVRPDEKESIVRTD
jgi:REP element-mobilizing transposase RayT